MSQAERPSNLGAGAAVQHAGLLDRCVLFGTVTVTGGAVMVLELLGTRIIGPYFGVSLYVWSALIAVTLIALAVGYFLGGWCADHVPGVRLAHVALLAALGTTAIPLLSGPILTMAETLGMRAGALYSACVLFLVPLTCLGMAGPLVVKLATRELDGVGTAAGSVYAISTVGSVVATVALGFYLLPVFGTRSIIEGTGVALLALGGGLAAYERKRIDRRQWAALATVAMLASGAFAVSLLLPVRAAAGFTVLGSAESIYGWVRVVDDEQRGIRLLLSDASSIGAVDRRTGDSVLDYQQILTRLPHLLEGAKAVAAEAASRRALLIGLGAGTVATRLKAQGLRTDTIEIDPAVALAAREHFGFEPTGLFIVGDGRHEVRTLPRRYDYIIHDCFTGGSEPVHLLTVEMFEQLRSMLTADGILVVNFVGFAHGEGAEALASVARTLDEAFPFQRMFATHPDAELSDYVILASQQPIRFTAHTDAERNDLAILEGLERRPPKQGAVLLTDDYNPLEHMQGRKAELYRRLFLQRVSADLLLR